MRVWVANGTIHVSGDRRDDTVERSPTITLVGVFVVVYLFKIVLGLLSVPLTALALAPPVVARPWTLVTSVYTHAGPGHLLANSVALLFLGLVLEQRTSRMRFHAFFLVTGVLAGLAQVWVGSLVGPPVAVVGASGAVFALAGYLLAGNRVSDSVVSSVPLSGTQQVLVFAVVAALVTLVTAGRGVALVSHFTGLLLGLFSGRVHLLRR